MPRRPDAPTLLDAVARFLQSDVVPHLADKGAFVAKADGTFAVDHAKIKGAVRDLVGELLTIEAEGDYARAKKLLEEQGVLRPAVKAAIDKLADLPTDIEPVRK